MPDSPKSPWSSSRKPAPDRPDNVIRFSRPPAGPGKGNGKGGPGGPVRGGGPPPDWRRLIAGREGLVGFAAIVLLAIVLVLWRRMGG